MTNPFYKSIKNIFLGLLILILLSGCSTSTKSNDYYLGYDNGFDDGYAIGYDEGIEISYDNDFEEGYEFAEDEYKYIVDDYEILEDDYNELLQVTLCDLFLRHNKTITENTPLDFDCIELKYSTELSENKRILHYSLTISRMNLSDYYVEHQSVSDTTSKYWGFSEEFPLSYYGIYYKDNGAFESITTSIYGNNYFEASENSTSYISNNELKDYITIEENIDTLYIVGCVNSELYGAILNLSN